MFELREGSCYPKALTGVNVALASVDAVIALLAFAQLMRIHSRNTHIGWTRQKVFHLMIGSSNLGYFLYFVLSLVAACKGWLCWSHFCGFVVMASPKILFLAAFLLLLSFWVDLCHQSNDEEDEDDGYSPREALLEKNKPKSNADSRRRCCSFRAVNVGSRQKVVVLVKLIKYTHIMFKRQSCDLPSNSSQALNAMGQPCGEKSLADNSQICEASPMHLCFALSASYDSEYLLPSI